MIEPSKTEGPSSVPNKLLIIGEMLEAAGELLEAKHDGELGLNPLIGELLEVSGELLEVSGELLEPSLVEGATGLELEISGGELLEGELLEAAGDDQVRLELNRMFRKHRMYLGKMR